MPTLSSSNSYATYADYQAYCDLAGKSVAAQATVEPRLIQATLAIDRKYGGRFIGRKLDANQPLAWPRAASSFRNIDVADGYYSVDQDGNYRDLGVVPEEVKQAVCEVALSLLNGEDQYSVPSPMVTSASEKIDVIQTTYTYAGNFSERSQSDYLVDLILRPLLLSGATTVKFTA